MNEQIFITINYLQVIFWKIFTFFCNFNPVIDVRHFDFEMLWIMRNAFPPVASFLCVLSESEIVKR